MPNQAPGLTPPPDDVAAMQLAWNGLREVETQLNLSYPWIDVPAAMPMNRQKRISRIRLRRVQRSRMQPTPRIQSEAVGHFWTLFHAAYHAVIVVTPPVDPGDPSGLFNSVLGFNLDGIHYGTSHQPFKNLFLAGSYWFSNGSRSWVVQPPGDGWAPDMTTPDYGWNEGPEIVLDEYGYPAEIALNCYADRIIKVGGVSGLPGGDYVILWTGDGYFGDNSSDHYSWQGPRLNTMSISGTLLSEDLSATPKRAVFRIVDNQEVRLRLKKINPADPIRDVVVCHIDDEGTVFSQPFSQAYIDKMAKASAVRLMDVLGTNHNPASLWSDRVLETDCIQQCDSRTRNNVTYYGRGISYEWLAKLVNTVYLHRVANGATDYAVWFNAPHAGDDNYFYQMGRLLKQKLNSAIKVRIEYSNEVWNSGLFTQGRYASEQGQLVNIAPGDTGFDNQIFFSARRHMVLWQKFREGWNSVGVMDADDRVINVLGGWATNPDYNRKILDWVDPLTGHAAWETCDEVALAPYFDGVGIPYEETIEAHWDPQPGILYSFTLGAYTFAYETPVDLDVNISASVRRDTMARDLLSQVEASPLMTAPDSRFDFLVPLYDGVALIKGFRLFYKLEKAFIPPLTYFSPTVQGLNTALPHRYGTCRLNNSYFDDSYAGTPTSWSDRDRFELWRLSLTADETINYCLAETAIGGQTDRDLQAHLTVFNAQTWTRKPRITFYEVGTHLYSAWMSSDERAEALLTVLFEVEASQRMREIVVQYLARLKSVIPANNISQGSINWFSMTGGQSKYGSWGLWLPNPSQKWYAIMDWLEDNHY